MTPTAATVIDHLTAGRAQMGSSLAFHLTFAVLGVGLPLMMLIAEGMHLRTGDPVWRALARRWSKAFAILFAVGAVSGTIISFELDCCSRGSCRSPAESSACRSRWRALRSSSRRSSSASTCTAGTGSRHSLTWLAGFPLALSAVASALFVVTANAWMNVPARV